MNLTVNIEENGSVQVSEEIVETAEPARVQFAVEGVLSISEELLEGFEESSLKPVHLEIAVDSSRTVGIDLTGAASILLDTIDVGVETPDTDDLSPGVVDSDDDEGGTDDTRPGAIAFTVEGAVTDVPTETHDSLGEGSLGLAAITFAVEDAVESDGGARPDPLLEMSLLGFEITVHRDGTIDVDRDDDVTNLGLS